MNGLAAGYRLHLRSAPGTFVAALLLVACLAAVDAHAQADRDELERQVTRSLHGPDGLGKDGPLSKIGTNLIRLYRTHEDDGRGKRRAHADPTEFSMPVLRNGRVVIDAVARTNPQVLLDRLEDVGLRHAAVSGRVVSGRIPVDALDRVARIDGLNEARAALAMPRIGATTSQGDVTIYADTVRETSVLDGDGVTVGVLSDSYNNHEGSPATKSWDDVRTGDLPGSQNPFGHSTPVDVLEDDVPGSDEGRALLQIVHDLAPKAALAFQTALGGIASFANGIRRLAERGSDIILDDVVYFAEPFFQDGLVGQAIDEVAAENDVIYVTAAGNSGDNAYATRFRDSGSDVSSILGTGTGDFHDFDPTSGTDSRQEITIGGGQTLILSMQWDDPYYSVSGAPGADTDLDIYLLDGSTAVTRSIDDNIGGDPVEILVYHNTGERSVQLDLAIARAQGPEPERLKYVVFGGARLGGEYHTRSPTLVGHADASAALSVGAVAWYNTSRVPSYSRAVLEAPILNGFSAKGGTPLLYDRAGNRLDPPVIRQKPSLTAPDGVNTTFFGFDILADPDRAPNFFGTSAAAPHVAAVAALMRQARPELAPEEAREHLRATATDIVERLGGGEPEPIPNGEGFDFFSGAGMVRADAAALSLLPARIASLRAEVNEGTTQTQLDWTTVREAQSRRFIVEYHPGERKDNPATAMWRRVGSVQSKAHEGESSDTLRYKISTTLPSAGRYVFRLRHQQKDGTTQSVGSRTEVNLPIDGAFELGGPDPHPVTRHTEIQLVLKRGQEVRIRLYDALGRRVRTLHDGYLAPEHPLLLRVDASDLASGTYFLRADGAHFTATRKLVHIR